MMAYRYFIKLAYNGSAYSGWQVQPNATTVQKLIDNGLAVLAEFGGSVTGCGRTDAGVNARVFYAHFDHEVMFSTEALMQLSFRLNRFLPQDIVIHEIVPVLPGGHARFSALWREYEYFIIREKDPFNYNNAYFVQGNLNIDIMNACANLMWGKHDFQCFSKVNTQVKNYFCNIHFARWEEQEHFLKFKIRADRFLRNMVRSIVGTLLDVGRGKISVAEFNNIMNSHDRSEASLSVPAKGLTLTDVRYPELIFSEKAVFFSPESNERIISHYYADPKFHESSGHETNE